MKKWKCFPLFLLASYTGCYTRSQSRSQRLRSPWTAVGKRELWDQPFQACAIGADCAVSRMDRIWLFPLLFENGYSQSSRFLTAGQGERSLWERDWLGAFSIYKKIRKISIWEERVPFVTSSIRGSRGRPGRWKDREKHGTGDEDEKSVNGTQISTGKTGLHFQEFRLFRKISSGTNQKVVFHLHPNRNFLVNGNALDHRQNRIYMPRVIL